MPKGRVFTYVNRLHQLKVEPSRVVGVLDGPRLRFRSVIYCVRTKRPPSARRFGVKGGGDKPSDLPRYWECEKTSMGFEITTMSASDPRANELHLRRKHRLNLDPDRCCEVVRSLSFLKVAVYTPEFHPLCTAKRDAIGVRLVAC